MALQAYAPTGGSSELACEAGMSAPGVAPNGGESCAQLATRRPSIAPATAVHDLASHTARAELEAVIARHATMADAAAALGITRSTLYRRLQRHGLVPGRSVRAR
jgi:DNA-binding phage protein